MERKHVSRAHVRSPSACGWGGAVMCSSRVPTCSTLQHNNNKSKPEQRRSQHRSKRTAAAHLVVPSTNRPRNETDNQPSSSSAVYSHTTRLRGDLLWLNTWPPPPDAGGGGAPGTVNGRLGPSSARTCHTEQRGGGISKGHQGR